MSDTDSFIDEVSEEVRRDKLFAYIRKYGWIAVLAVILLVGGAAWSEWTKARDRAAAEARGDAILAALAEDDHAARLAALSAIAGAGPAGPVVAQLRAAAALEAKDTAAAAQALRLVADDATQPVLYRDLAALKLAILTAADTDPAALIATLQPLAAPGAPFRTLAEEQIAMAEVRAGDTDAAIARLSALLEDAEASTGLRGRASRLIVALGGEVSAVSAGN